MVPLSQEMCRKPHMPMGRHSDGIRNSSPKRHPKATAAGGCNDIQSEGQMANRIELGHGLVLNFTRKDGETVPSDVWVQFWGADGKSAAISIAAEAERTGGIIGAGLRS